MGGIADDVLRDLLERGKYLDVILPMRVIRRMDAGWPAEGGGQSVKKKGAREAKTVRSKAISKGMGVASVERAFDEIVELIRTARQQAARAVNTELIELYWRIGDYLHRKIGSDGWAKGPVVQLAAYVAQREPGLRGFSPQNL